MKKLFVLLFVLKGIYSFAQLSDEHYIPPVFAKKNNKGVIESYKLFLSTPSDSIFYVKLYQGTNKKVLDSVKISSQTPNEIGFWKAVMLGEEHLNKNLDIGGFYLKADLPFYANTRAKSGAQGGSMTSKGKAGLGTDFRTGHMVSGFNIGNGWWDTGAQHFISVMATKDNTKITFSGIKQGVRFRNLPTEGKNKSKLTTKDFSITLNKGQSYIISEFANEFQRGDENKSFGTHVTSTKPIAVNCGSLLCASPVSLNTWDIGFDQIVPINGIGKEYILIIGEGTDELERPIVIATENGTVVEFNGKEVARLNEGEHFIGYASDFSDNGNLYIKANKNIYLYQNMAGSTNHATCGLNFIPPLNDCVSSNKVFIPQVNYIGDKTVINVVLKPYSEIYFIDPTTNKILEERNLVTTNLKKELKQDWITTKYTVPKGMQHILVKSDFAINVSMTNNSGAIGAASYFSGFAPPPLIIPVGGKASYYSSGKLDFKLRQGEIYDKFRWYKDGKFIKETKTTSFQTTETGTYQVIGIDKTCEREFASPTFVLNEIKDLKVDEEIFQEEPENELEEAIVKKEFNPNVLVNINFKYNSNEFLPNAKPTLDNMIATLRKYPTVKIEIKAHTDCRGKAEYNLQLSQKRANYVKAYMVQKGIASDRLLAKGMGETEPLLMATCDCDKEGACSEAQHLLNRRSEFVVVRE